MANSISQHADIPPQLTLVASGGVPQTASQISLDPLGIVQAATASLDLSSVLQTLNRFIGEQVQHSGWHYRHAVHHIELEGGTRDRHCLEYELTLNDHPVGSLLLMRGRRFSEQDQADIEQILELVTPALANALNYHALMVQLERDSLTGLGNRLALFREGCGWLADAERHDRELSILALDLDGFKAVNDQFGHPDGDRLLIAVAEALRATTRESDLCARLGGDEFVVLLPGTSLGQAMKCAERIRHAIAAHSILTAQGVSICAQTSIGVALYQPGMTIEQLYRQADDALYAAKRAGRNRILAA